METQPFLPNLADVLVGSTSGFFDGFASGAAALVALAIVGLLSAALTGTIVAVTLGDKAGSLGVLALAVLGVLAAVLGAAFAGLMGLLGLLLAALLLWGLLEVAFALRASSS